MRCKDFQMRLARQLDGELDPASQDQLSEHLAACDRCRRVEESLLWGRHLCRSARATWAPPADFAPRVLRSVQAEKAQRATLWAQLSAMAERMIPAFAMLTLLFFGIFFLMYQVSEVRPRTHDADRDLFISAEDGSLLIAQRGDITQDHVIKTVLEGN